MVDWESGCCTSTLALIALCGAVILYVMSSTSWVGQWLKIRTRKCRMMWRKLIGKGSGETAKRALKYVTETCASGIPDLALAAMDEYIVKNGEFMMNVGPEKGEILDKEIARVKPKVALEMGAYCGYSAVRIARLLKAGEGRLISFEIDPEFADNARAFIKFAGVDDRAEVVLGDSSSLIPQLKDRFGVSHVDLVFLDHVKNKYGPDLSLLEKHGLLRPGSIVVADNILYPGNPMFKAQILASPNYKVVVHEANVEYSSIKDEVIVAEFLG